MSVLAEASTIRSKGPDRHPTLLFLLRPLKKQRRNLSLRQVLVGLKKNFEIRAGQYYGAAVLLEISEILRCPWSSNPAPIDSKK
ncbi:MAG: hypothetical protein ABR538_00970 [Candidatus Binatia bacterium]